MGPSPRRIFGATEVFCGTRDSVIDFATLLHGFMDRFMTLEIFLVASHCFGALLNCG